MQILVLPLLLAFLPLYETTKPTRLGGEWSILRESTATPVVLSTNPSEPVCRAELSINDTVEVAHTIYKARVLPGTIWSHVTVYGHTVMASSSVDGSQVRVLAADDDPLHIGHTVCVLVLTQNLPPPEAQKLENAILDAGTV